MHANRSAHKPGDDVVELSTDSVVQISECLAEPGLCKAIDGDASGPFTAAQNSELHRIFNASIMLTLDPFIDLIIGKVQTLITTEMQASFEPVCCDLRSQIKFLQREFSILQKEYFSNPVPVQNRMKRYCFKRRDNGEIFPKPRNTCIDPEKVDTDS